MQSAEIISEAFALHKKLLAYTDFILNNYAPNYTADNYLNKSGSSLEFWQYRNYNNDYAKNIDWKKSAREDNIIIKETQNQSSSELNIIIDNSENMNFKSENQKFSKHEYSLIIGIGLCLTLLKSKYKITINNKSMKYDAGYILNALSTNNFAPKHGKTNLIISDFIENNNLENHGDNLFLQINDLIETNFEFTGRIEFYNSDLKILINDAETSKNDYINRFNEYYSEFKQRLKPKAYISANNNQDVLIPSKQIIEYLVFGGVYEN